MDIVKNNRKVIGIAAGAAAVAVGLYVLFKKALADDNRSKALTEDEIDKIIHGIKVDYSAPNVLSVSTISHIVDASMKLIAVEFYDLIWKDRKARRAYKDDIQKYIELYDEYLSNMDELISTCQLDILKELGISETTWEQSNNFYMDQQNRDVLLLHTSLPSRLKINMEPNKDLTKEEFISIMNKQIEYLEKEAGMAAEIMAKSSRPQAILGVIQNRINDRLAEELDIEEEDIFGTLRKFKDDVEVKMIMQRFQQAVRSMIQPPKPNMF